MRVAALTLLLVGGIVDQASGYDVEAWKRALLAERAKFTERLTSSESSSLAAVARVDFGDKKELVVGSAPDAAVHLDDPAILPHHLRVTADDTGFVVSAIDPKATFSTRAGEKREERMGPGAFKLGRYTLRLSHQGFPAIIVFDPESPRLKHGPKADWFAPDPKYRVVARLERDANPAEVVIQSTRGNRRKALKLGRFVFSIDGTEHRLEANRFLEPGVGENDVSIFFRDATTGKTSYPVGRYVDPERGAGDEWVIDFNRAYNPACAWSDHYNCPIPPKANTLAVPILAGEKPPVGGDH